MEMSVLYQTKSFQVFSKMKHMYDNILSFTTKAMQICFSKFSLCNSFETFCTDSLSILSNQSLNVQVLVRWLIYA